MRLASIILIMSVCGVLGACSGTREGVRTPEDPDPQVLRSAVRTPFAPARLRIHPLTSLSKDQANQPVLTLYVEMLDAWEDSVKAVGLLTAEVFDGPQVRQWNVDLFDMDINGPAYDPHTRTYRFVLGQMPSWVGEISRVRVFLQTVDAAGEPLELFDETVLR